ncbi:aromatic alcohol reductase [Phanerochaete sordida]|uniref:Aromatic alcohol reductase n=1 Tax=Phanerochaete sordida TaxID=48140 RepID=A0A9P3G2Z8_9APHY|nr:aromatic alcohol reductase [Phanerochaete sordida]
MVKVAVAGGTGGIGLHIVEGIVASGKHEVIVLSRRASHPALDALGVRMVAVSYDDRAALTAALQGVHTVISTIAGLDAASMVAPQLALLDAAKAAGVRRFAPSEFAVRAIPDNPVELYRLKWPVVEAVRASGLEYTIFEDGIFMNYLASGTAGVGHLHPITVMVDVEHATATVPGDGSAHIVYTRAEDVGAFVAASLDLPRWPEFSQMRGDRLTLNEVVRLSEEARGKKFEVTYLSEEQILAKLRNRENPNAVHPDAKFAAFDFEKFIYEWYLEIVRSNVTGYEGKNLNELCPQVKPVSVKEFLQMWWGKKE